MSIYQKPLPLNTLNPVMLKILKVILLPFSILYGSIVAFRNFLYLTGIKKRFKVPQKSIVVGNLSVGGTGKTPMIAYLVELLSNHPNKTQVISRGYGRESKGFRNVLTDSSPADVGDESLLLKKRFPDTSFTVSESRKEAILKIEKKQKSNIYLFDDAFQHLAIQAEINILLTTFQKPFFNDFMLPSGTLREFSYGVKRADIIIITKSPYNIDNQIKNTFYQKLNFKKENIYFSWIQYGQFISFSNMRKSPFDRILLITGIANSKPLEVHLLDKYEVETISFSDHHSFTHENIDAIHQKFGKFAPDGNGIILTTEKDFVKLSQAEFAQKINQYPWYYQPISIEIDRKEDFEKKILNYVNSI